MMRNAISVISSAFGLIEPAERNRLAPDAWPADGGVGGRLVYSLACLLTGLGACVTPPPNPVPLGDGVYTIDAGGSGSGRNVAVEDEGYQRAIRFCFEQGKQLVRVDGPDGASTDPRQRAGGGLQFRCAGPGEPGWKEPVG